MYFIEVEGKCIFKNDRLTCRTHLPNIFYPNNVTVLELLDIEWRWLNLTGLVTKFPHAENITILGKKVKTIIPPPAENRIRILQITNLQVTTITQELLNNLTNVDTLILTDNNLQTLDKNITFRNIQNVYLADNKWNCTKDLDWVLNLNESVIKDLELLRCQQNVHTGIPLLVVAQFMKDIKSQCPSECTCKLPKIVKCLHCEDFEPMTEVNCIESNFTEMPASLPSKTKTLKLQGNSIKSLSPLRENPLYRTVIELYVDDNSIESIDLLEGSHWFTHFRVFSLRGNMISEIPTYALDNALQQNTNMPNAVRLTFGDNPWRCDCTFTPVFQEMLLKYEPQIRDINDIRCSYVEGDENSLQPIIELSKTAVCQLPSEYSIQVLDLLNVVLATLIVLILGKLAYDYYHFKKTGKLPWIVRKMP